MQNEQSIRDSIRTCRKILSKSMYDKNTHVLYNTENQSYMADNGKISKTVSNAISMTKDEAIEMANATKGVYEAVSKYISVDKELQSLYRKLSDVTCSKKTEELFKTLSL